MRNAFAWIIILGLFLGTIYIIHTSNVETTSELSSLFHINESSYPLVARASEIKDEAEKRAEAGRVYTILAGGDVMLDRSVESKVMNDSIGKGDWTFPWKYVADDFTSADLAFVNLEGSVSDVGRDLGKKFSFRFKPESLAGLQYAGIDLVSIANNHMLDWGQTSLCATTTNLEAYGIRHVGAGCNDEIAYKPYTVDLGNTKVAFIGYTQFVEGPFAGPDRPGMTEFDQDNIIDLIHDLKANQGVDVVMMSMHWGVEYETRSRAYQQDIAHNLIDNGLDVLIGHHPHVAQEIERYGDGWVMYSLGNFIFDQYFSENTMKGLVAEIQIQNKEVRDIVPHPLVINTNYQPAIVKTSTH